MSKGVTAEQEQRFWDRYIKVLNDQGIKPPSDRWHEQSGGPGLDLWWPLSLLSLLLAAFVSLCSLVSAPARA
jgi:hypothetical protein